MLRLRNVGNYTLADKGENSTKLICSSKQLSEPPILQRLYLLQRKRHCLIP